MDYKPTARSPITAHTKQIKTECLATPNALDGMDNAPLKKKAIAFGAIAMYACVMLYV